MFSCKRPTGTMESLKEHQYLLLTSLILANIETKNLELVTDINHIPKLMATFILISASVTPSNYVSIVIIADSYSNCLWLIQHFSQGVQPQECMVVYYSLLINLSRNS